MNAQYPRRLCLVAVIAPLAAAGFPAAADDSIIVGSSDSGAVRVFTAGSLAQTFQAFSPDTSSVRVAVGDVDGDAVPDIFTGTGPGPVSVITRHTATGAAAFRFQSPFGNSYTGGIYVAAGDVTGDNRAEVFISADDNLGGRVWVCNPNTGSSVRTFLAYPTLAGGVTIAAGDINGDGRADIITGRTTNDGAPVTPHVKIFNGTSGAEIRSFMAFDPAFTGGINVASGDVNGDGRADIIVGTASGASHVKIFSGIDGAEIRSFFPFSPTFTGGVFVGADRPSGSPQANIITSPASGTNGHVRVFRGSDLAELASFFAFPQQCGVFVAGGASASGLVVGAGDGLTGGQVKVFSQSGVETRSFYTREFRGGVRVALADNNADGISDLFIAPGRGTNAPRFSQFITGSTAAPKTVAVTLQPRQNNVSGLYIATADFNNDQVPDVVVAPDLAGEPTPLAIYNGATNAQLASFLAFPGFSGPVRLATGDFNGDSVPDIFAGQGPGGTSEVRIFSGVNQSLLDTFTPFPGSPSGVFVAAGRMNSDNRADLIVGGDSDIAGGHVRVFDAATRNQLDSFFAFPGFNGGVRVAAGDVSSDGLVDIITATGPGGPPRVIAFGGQAQGLLHEYALPPTIRLGYTGGVFIGAGRFTNNRDDAVISTDAEGDSDPDGTVVALNFNDQITFSRQTALSGGVVVASGDISGDGAPDIVVASGAGAHPHIKIFDAQTGLKTGGFLPFTFGGLNPIDGRAPVSLATGRFNNDAFADIIVAGGPGSRGFIEVFDPQGNALFFIQPFPPSHLGGINIAGGDVTGDGLDDVIAAPGPSAPPVVIAPIILRFSAPSGAFLPPITNPGNFVGGIHVAAADVTGDNRADIAAAGMLPGGFSAEVRIFNGANNSLFRTIPVQNLFASQIVNVAFGDVRLETVPHIIVGLQGSVRVYDVMTGALLDEFFPDPGSAPGYTVARIPAADDPPCPADFNGDGLVFPDDLSEFITCFFLEVQFPGFCPRADFNGDTLTFPDDLSEFITTFFLSVQFGC